MPVLLPDAMKQLQKRRSEQLPISLPGQNQQGGGPLQLLMQKLMAARQGNSPFMSGIQPEPQGGAVGAGQLQQPMQQPSMAGTPNPAMMGLLQQLQQRRSAMKPNVNPMQMNKPRPQMENQLLER